jgi:Arc/MetJ-type ribon-helix-helix transcriptional regulator
MLMPRLKKMVSYALDPALLARLDEWLARQDVAPSKTAVIEAALRAWLDEREPDPEPKKRPRVASK